MQSFFVMLGLSNLALSQMLVIVALAWGSAFALAWIADAILGDGVFGVMLNMYILIIGAVVGTLLWSKFSYGVIVSTPLMLSLIAAGCGIGLLIVCGVLRRWI